MTSTADSEELRFWVRSRSFRSRKETLDCCVVDRRNSSYSTLDLVTGITREPEKRAHYSTHTRDVRRLSESIACDDRDPMAEHLSGKVKLVDPWGQIGLGGTAILR